MRFLIDECLSVRLASLLKQAGHDAVHVVDLGLGGCPDTEVMAQAVQDRRILVSIDTDFGELLVQRKATTPSVLLFRKGQHDPKLISEVLLANLSEAAADLANGAIVVITNNRMKIRRLPIASGVSDAV